MVRPVRRERTRTVLDPARHNDEFAFAKFHAFIAEIDSDAAAQSR